MTAAMLRQSFGRPNMISIRSQAPIVAFAAADRSDGMTRIQLAEAWSKYHSFVARLESGQRRVDVVALIRPSDGLGRHLGEMMKAVVKGCAGLQ